MPVGSLSVMPALAVADMVAVVAGMAVVEAARDGADRASIPS